MHKLTPRFAVLNKFRAVCLGGIAAFCCATALAAPADYNTQPAAATPADSGWESAAPAERDVTRPQLVLLLPFNSPRFGEAANVVSAGFRAAVQADGNKVDVVTLSGDDASVVHNYQRALALQPKVIIGPLTRPGIVDVSSQVKVPTLALNSFDANVAVNPQLYGLSLAMENEAEQMAEQMAVDGFKKPLLVGHANDALSQRLMTAFSDAWRKKGGKNLLTFVYNQDDAQKLTTAAADYDAVFLALAPAETYAVRPLLSSGRPLYGTTMLHSRQPDAALAGIHIAEMPWFDENNAQVTRYARAQSAMSMDSERLYALGIDAYTAAMLLANGATGKRLQFDGATGQLSLGERQQFVRRMPLLVLPAPQVIQAPEQP